ncbi:MAG: hypothetical protein NTX11_01500 [Candidatus Saccharibacteria bacterium]|nr:hypothetical protein [Candidatus Saccharibacteria bacterium]
MTYKDFIDLSGLIAAGCISIALFVFLALVFPRDGLVLNRKRWDSLTKDYRDPNIAVGGPIGIVLKLLKVGLFFAVLTGLLFIFERFTT